MTPPRPHAELAAKYYADSTLKCWARRANTNTEWELIRQPSWLPEREYHVGYEPPTKSIEITATVNGNTKTWRLPEPVTEVPNNSERLWYCWAEGTVDSFCWDGGSFDVSALNKRRLHLTKEDAKAWLEFETWCHKGGKE